MEASLNVLGTPLKSCSLDPKTGWYRDGCCNTDTNDHGSHTVCAKVTTQFLEYLAVKGNDLMTPVPAYDFPGLKSGDRWCLCALRWREALEAGVAPPLFLRSTHERALEVVELDQLLPYALDLPKNG